MDSNKNKKSSPKRTLCYILGGLSILIVIFLPFTVEKIFYMNAPCSFFEVNYDAADILSYYGSVLSFIGATILGVLTLRQNKKAQEKSDEVNRLQLELQKKSMAMAEAHYTSNGSDSQVCPKFQVSLHGYSGNYANLSLSLKNVSSMIVSNISPISLIVQQKLGEEIANGGQLEIKPRALSPIQEAVVNTNTPNLVTTSGKQTEFYSDIILILSFSCEDEKGNTHYLRATATVPSTKNYYSEPWLVEKVG